MKKIKKELGKPSQRQSVDKDKKNLSGSGGRAKRSSDVMNDLKAQHASVREESKTGRRKATDRSKDPSYISTYKNYRPRGGTLIEPSRTGENELRESAFTHAEELAKKKKQKKTDYDKEALSYNKEEDYKWGDPSGEVDYSRFTKRGKGRYARDDYKEDK